MWGNRQGWVISAIIALVMGYMLWTLSRVGDVSPPSGEFKNLTARIELPVKPEQVVTVMTDDRDAGDLYWKAIEQYQVNPDLYKNFLAPRKRKPGEQPFSIVDNVNAVPAVQLLVDATTANRATIFMRKPETLINYRYPYPELDALHTLGQIAGQIGFSHANRGNEQGAKKYLHAQFSLGDKLFDERVSQTELLYGVMHLRGATAGLIRLAERQNEEARKAELEQFDAATKDYYESQIDKLAKKVVSIGRQDIHRYAGDVFVLARSSPERMWRVEALLKTGRYKYNAGRYWDQVWARRYLSEPQRVGEKDPTQDPDPAVKLAATIARDLTPDGYNQIDFSAD